MCVVDVQDANFLFLGGLMIAISIEKWGLHKRVALRVLMLVGSKPVWYTLRNYRDSCCFMICNLANLSVVHVGNPLQHCHLLIHADNRYLISDYYSECKVK